MKLNIILYSLFSTLILSFKSYAVTEENITFAAFFNFSGSQSSLDTFTANSAKLALDSLSIFCQKMKFKKP
ncbi:MAG: hypothetical protein V4591_03820 [Bdellovibrionota bacterium]